MSKKSQPTNRSRTPHSDKFMKFISSQWAEIEGPTVSRWEVADFAAKRRQAIAEAFPGKQIILDAGAPKVRSNDTDYRYRPDTAFTHMTGWGSATVPGAVLVIDSTSAKAESTLYLLPTAGKNTDEFFANPAIGEFWVGPRPTLEDIEKQLGIKTKDIKDFKADKKKWNAILDIKDEELSVALSSLRFVKDEFEIKELKKAIDITAKGFSEVVKSLPKASRQQRGERVVETAFYSTARQLGYELGYETIAASGAHACILHWTKNDGDVKTGDVILVDAGAEVDSLYTADITRTIPVNGTYSKEQLWMYNVVLEAADAAFKVVKPGIKFRDIHNAAISVIAEKVAELGLIPVSAEEALESDNQHHRRYMVHGTSHHLGLDVHDCAQARREMYQDGTLAEGMVFTIEPGLYFHQNDLTVPENYRGIGIRIEDNVLVTKTGSENLSAMIPRGPKEIEAWYEEELLGGAG